MGLMLDKLRKINYGKLNRIASDIAENNDRSVSYVKRDMVRNFLAHGIGYTDYMKGDYINLTPEQKKTFLTSKNYDRLLKYLNDSTYTGIFIDKITFNKVFRNYIGRDFVDLRSTSVAEFSEFLQKNMGKKLFAKPNADFGGHGIECFEVTKDMTAEEKRAECIGKGQYLVEEAIIQHEEINRMCPFAVNTFRIVTLVKDNVPYVLENAMRTNSDESVALSCDDVFMRIASDGRVRSNVVDDLMNTYENHPVTGVPFSEIRVPFVKEAYRMIEKAAMEVPEVRYVGWDVAIGQDGPVIIEGNQYPSYGLVQYFMLDGEHEGHLKKIAAVLGDEMKEIRL